MATLTNEELTAATRSLESRIAQLAAPYENALSHRVFESVQKTFRTWLTIWTGAISFAISGFLGVVGYVGYHQIVAAAKGTIQDQVTTYVSPRLQKEIDVEISKAVENARKVLLERSLDSVAKLDADLAQLKADTQSAIDQRIKEFATKLAVAIKDRELPRSLADKPKPPTLSGFAYYGIYSGGVWSERNFRVSGTVGDAYPRLGDIVIAEVPVNARSGVIELTLRGWVNKPAVGLIRPGRKLEVQRVETVAGGSYVWIEFVTKD